MKIKLQMFFFIFITILFTVVDEQKLIEIDLISRIKDLISLACSILFTLLIAKLYFDKERRNQRQSKIDELSEKVTLLRELACLILCSDEFWIIDGINVKSRMRSSLYKELTYEKHKVLEGEESKTYNDTYGYYGRAFLALEGLVGNKNCNVFFKDYKSDEFGRYTDYNLSFIYFLRNVDVELFDKIKKKIKDSIKEIYLKIVKKEIEENEFKISVINLFSTYEDSIFGDLVNEIKIKEKRHPFYTNGLISFVFFLIIYFALINIDLYNIKILKLIISLFISNFLFFIIELCEAILDELKIESIYD